MGSKNGCVISRREFARRAAFVSAAASLSPADLLTEKSPDTAKPLSQAPSGPKLSAESQTEMESRSEEHTSELQSRSDLVCRLLLEKKKNKHEMPERPCQRRHRSLR